MVVSATLWWRLQLVAKGPAAIEVESSSRGLFFLPESSSSSSSTSTLEVY